MPTEPVSFERDVKPLFGSATGSDGLLLRPVVVRGRQCELGRDPRRARERLDALRRAVGPERIETLRRWLQGGKAASPTGSVRCRRTLPTARTTKRSSRSSEARADCGRGRALFSYTSRLTAVARGAQPGRSLLTTKCRNRLSLGRLAFAAPCDRNGAAPESNRPSRGLHDRTGFEDPLGHRARPLRDHTR